MALAPAYLYPGQPVSAAIAAAPADEHRPRQRRVRAGAVLLLIIAVVANLAIIGIIVSQGNPASTAPAHPQTQTLPAPAPAAALPPGLPTTLGEGKFVVGTDIAPGTYHTTGPSSHLDCYWERLKRTLGADSIIANSLGRDPATVTIDGTDGVFQTRWCSTWTKVN